VGECGGGGIDYEGKGAEVRVASRRPSRPTQHAGTIAILVRGGTTPAGIAPKRQSWLAISHHFIETSPMKVCPFCFGEMRYTVSICPHCGRDWLTGVSHGVPIQPVQRARPSNNRSGRSWERPALILFFLLLYLVGIVLFSALFDIH
jgi:rRNA maturation protein Nop10